MDRFRGRKLILEIEKQDVSASNAEQEGQQEKILYEKRFEGNKPVRPMHMARILNFSSGRQSYV